MFSNEVDIRLSPLEQFASGDLVSRQDSAGKALGVAYVNPNWF